MVSHVDAFAGFNWYPLDEIVADARVLKVRLPFHMRIVPTLFIHRRLSPQHSQSTVGQNIDPVQVYEYIPSQKDQEPVSLDQSISSITAIETIDKNAELAPSTGPSAETLTFAETTIISTDPLIPASADMSSETGSTESLPFNETSRLSDTISPNSATGPTSEITSADVFNQITSLASTTSALISSSTVDSDASHLTQSVHSSSIYEQAPNIARQTEATESFTNESADVEYEDFGDDSLDDEL